MEEMTPDQPQPQSTHAAAPSASPGTPAASPKTGGRRLLPVLAALYLCSIAAALALLMRGGNGGGASAESHAFFRAPKRLLSASRESGVGWVAIRGPIYESASGRVWEKGMEQWSRRIKELGNKNEVKAIVLDINSPGGSVGAVQELYQVILRVRNEKKKPVVALVGDMAASGGYYLASACDKVVAHPGSLLGSIGVIFNTTNVEPLLNKLGVKFEPVKSGKYKDIGSPTRAMTKEERALLQAIIDDAYGQFLGAVAEGRHMPVEKVRPLADGRIFTGGQALALGMVDQLGDAHDALMLAGKMGGISGTPKVVRDTDSLESVLDLLDSRFSDWLRPEASFIRQASELAATGLEYRWTGFH